MMDLLVACYRWCLRNGRLRTFSGIFRAPRLASEVTLFGFFWANQRADQKLVKFRAPSQGYLTRASTRCPETIYPACCLQFPMMLNESQSTSRASLTALREHILRAVRLANHSFQVEFGPRPLLS